MTKIVKIGKVTFGDGSLSFIAGPCVIETADVTMRAAEALAEISQDLNVGLVFKSSFDKANRSTMVGYRGPGFDEGIRILQNVKEQFGLPVISDIHETWQVEPATQVLDALQIPAFLARQTDLVLAAADSGLPVNVKKAQFMSPVDMAKVAGKMMGRPKFNGVLLCERGACFGYNSLVVDMRSLVIMAYADWPVVYDATHSVQFSSDGFGSDWQNRHFIPPLARAAAAVGVDAFFIETHPRPDKALCDSANQWPLNKLKHLLISLKNIHEVSKGERLHAL